ncbi:DsbA family oxidoreductase [Megasphaera hominis]|jgi:predicted DsbA family dithiol-disulfide isomerase|uniref:DsbA family oxidoreductase n=1 Tax=Megasphaera hominis TaxID=159836 RepID=A0ABR6VK45_9FIRM|nr:DsbA family oxidoreductase [Megasphaera hominis]MBC3537551.1 DsbA family oxidoreductase [Megasphaera hominis]
MKIEIWSDYACPYCYIGETRLKKALQALPQEASIDVVFRAFELDPSAPKEVTSTTPARFAKKYGLSEAGALQTIHGISHMGVQEGLDFKYATTRYTNTFDAHRLTKYAQSKGNTALIEALFQAYFSKNQELSDQDLLLQLATEAGLDPLEAKNVLQGDAFAQDVRDDEKAAYMNGINAVPFFLINGKYSISGAQPAELIQEALGNILEEEKEAQTEAAESAGMACGINGCSF